MNLKFFCFSLLFSCLIYLSSAEYYKRGDLFSNYNTLKHIKGIKKNYGILEKDSYEMEEKSEENHAKSAEGHGAVYPQISETHFEQTNYENPLKKKKIAKSSHEKVRKGKKGEMHSYEQLYDGPFAYIDPYALYAPPIADIYNPHLLAQPYDDGFGAYNPYAPYQNIYPYYTTTSTTTTTTTPTTTTTTTAGGFAFRQFPNSPEGLMQLLHSLNMHAQGAKTTSAKRRRPETSPSSFVSPFIAEKTLSEMKAQIAKTNEQIKELNKKATMFQKIKMQEAQKATIDKIKGPTVSIKNLELLRNLQQKIKESKLAQQQGFAANYANQYQFLEPQTVPIQKPVKPQVIPTSTNSNDETLETTSPIRRKTENENGKKKAEPLMPNVIFNIQAYSPEKEKAQQNVVYKYVANPGGEQSGVVYNINPGAQAQITDSQKTQVQENNFQTNTAQDVASQQTEFNLVGTKSDFISFGVVPDVLEAMPPQIVHVSHNGALIKLGNVLTAAETQTEPKLFWTADSKAYYTIMMTDADATPGAPTQREFLHWLVVNVPGNKIHLGEQKAPYIAPASGSKLHRYVITVYKQFGQRGFKEIPFFSKYTTSGRSFFNSRLFAKNISLGTVVGSFFYHA